MKTRHLFPILIVLCLLTACAAPAAAPTVTLPPTAMATATAAPTATRPPNTTTPTAAPTFTLLPPTLTPTDIPTPVPTLPVEEAKALILDLVQRPEDCLLPCLWGFTPGQTDLETARSFVSRFGIGDVRIGDIEIGAHNYDGRGSVGISYPKDNISIVIHFSYYKSEESSRLRLLRMWSLIKSYPPNFNKVS